MVILLLLMLTILALMFLYGTVWACHSLAASGQGFTCT